MLPGSSSEVTIELEDLEVREESDEIQDLAGRAFRFLESKKSKGGRKVSKTLFSVRHEAGCLKIVYSELLEVRECGKVMEIVSGKSFSSELAMRGHADAESLDEWKQPKVV